MEKRKWIYALHRPHAIARSFVFQAMCFGGRITGSTDLAMLCRDVWFSLKGIVE